MKYNSSNKPLVCMMTQSTCYKGTSKMAVKGVLWHSTGANNKTVKRYVQPDDNASNREELIGIIGKNAYRNDWNHIKLQAGVNAFIGELADGTIATVQVMPWDYKPWGCGAGSKGSCNNGFIQFEICESSLSDKAYFEKVYKEACELTAYLCNMYNLDPNGHVTMNGVNVPVILCHADSHKLGFGSNHGDVLHWFKKHGKTMDDVRKDVSNLIGKNYKPTTATTTAKPTASSSNVKFNKGDIVRVIGKTYYNGKTVPSFVVNNTWTVYSVSGDRVVIDKSSDGKYSIMSPFKADALSLVSSSVTKPSTSTATKPTTGASGNAIVNGTIVSIKKGAKYYNGKTIPDWVINKNWVVRGNPSGDKVIVDKSEDGKNSIYSAISSEYLTIVSGGGNANASTTTTMSVIKKGSNVKVKSGAKTYTGGALASFVYKTTYTVLQEPVGDRVVIGLNGVITAAVNKKDLIVV
jgi:hypothetical protein